MRFLSSNVDIFPKKPPKKIPTHINKQPLEERKKTQIKQKTLIKNGIAIKTVCHIFKIKRYTSFISIKISSFASDKCESIFKANTYLTLIVTNNNGAHTHTSSIKSLFNLCCSRF